jgi:ankyrin repeat protein
MKRSLGLGLPIKQPIRGFGNQTALHYACNTRAKPRVVAVLLEAGANVTDPIDAAHTPLMAAAFQGRLDLVKLLLSAGAKVDARDGEGETALSKACLFKTKAHEAIIQELLAAGATPTTDDLTIACENGNPAVVRALVAAGADFRRINRWGDTALHKAVDYGHLATVELLLAAGADPNFRLSARSPNYPKQTALDLAREKGKRMIALMESRRVDRK